MAIGILGGTFDPVHDAHVAMARAALEHLDLEKVLFMPTGAPRYRKPAVASAQDRLAMLRLALAGEPRFAIDARELAPGASGYTVDTLRAVREELGAQTVLYFLMGADQLERLATWHSPDEVRRLATLVAFARPGHRIDDETIRMIPMPPMDVSASDIRRRASRGEDLTGLVPPAVANYIARRRLYA
jgi:nicotinate-nucleotide adenylyltransferase